MVACYKSRILFWPAVPILLSWLQPPFVGGATGLAVSCTFSVLLYAGHVGIRGHRISKEIGGPPTVGNFESKGSDPSREKDRRSTALTVFVLRIADLPGTVLQRYPRRAADRTWRHRFTIVRDEGS